MLYLIFNNIKYSQESYLGSLLCDLQKYFKEPEGEPTNEVEDIRRVAHSPNAEV
jgi:hypothetical protein